MIGLKTAFPLLSSYAQIKCILKENGSRIVFQCFLHLLKGQQCRLIPVLDSIVCRSFAFCLS